MSRAAHGHGTPPDPEQIVRAVARLASGGLVAFPTETVYGLGADATRPEAVERVFRLKGRPAHNPLIVHVSGPAMARTIARWNDRADRLARAFWPGPLSIVLEREPGVPDAVTAGGPTVAVRCPDHALTLALVETFDRPLVGPSANASGRLSPTRAEHVRETFSEDDVLVLDGGPCAGGIESTVVSLVDTPARILRPGPVGAPELARALGEEIDDGIVEAAPGGVIRSPGAAGPHYRPLARAVLAEPAEIPALLDAVNGPAVVLAVTNTDVPEPHGVLPMPADAPAYARRLYAALREADARRPTLIIVERPGTGADAHAPIWRAVMERLSRATDPGA